MKYIFIILICFLGMVGYSQPVKKQARSNMPTVVDSSLAIGKNFILPVFRNFTQMANYSALDSSGRLVFIRDSNAVFFRDNAHTWVKLAYFAAGSGGWQLTGNTISSGQFLGTLNNLALALKAYNKNVASFNGNTMVVSLGDIDSVNNGTYVKINDAEGNDGNSKGQYEFNKRAFEIGNIPYIMPNAQGAPGSYLYNPGSGVLNWNVPGSGGTITGVDSVTISPPPPLPTTSVCYWVGGQQTCYPIIGNGVDSAKVLNDTLFVYANGDSVAYPLIGDQIFQGDTVTIENNLLCVTNNGEINCILINNGGQFVDSIWVDDTGENYVYGTKNGTVLGTFSTLQKDVIGVDRILVRDTLGNTAIAIYWDSAGFSTNVDLQTVINYTAATANPNNNAVADAVEGGYIGLKNKDDQNGFYTFSETHPLSKLSLLGVYDSVAQQVTSGFYGQGAQINILAPVGMTINSDVDSAGIVLQTRFSNTELPTDSLLAINTNGELKKRAVPSGSSQWITSGSDIYYNTGNVGIGTATLGNYRLSVNASGTDGILIDSAASFNVNGNTIGGESYIFGSENSISLSTKNAAETNLLTRIGIDGTLDIANVSILNANLIINAGALRLPSYTVATLPSGVEGDLVYITDGDAGLVWNDIAVGGGSGKLMAFYDGANWRVR